MTVCCIRVVPHTRSQSNSIIFFSILLQKEQEFLKLCANPTSTNDRVRRIEQFVQDPDADVNCVDSDGNNALLLLCRVNRCDDLYACIEALLQNRKSVEDCRIRIDINHQNKQGWNALLLLCRYHNDENLIHLFYLLIQHGINVRAKTKYGFTVLLLLSRYYDNENLLEIALLYLENGGDIDINCTTNFGSNSLNLLCRYYSCANLLDVIKFYIEHGIDVNYKNYDHRNALVILCRFRGSDNVIDCVKLLVENGSDINCADIDGWNALHFLCSNYSKKNLAKLVSYLTSHSPLLIRSKTNFGMTALEALSRNWIGVFHSLLNKLSAGVELDVQSLGGIILNTALLGCVHSTRALMLRLGAVPVDAELKDPFNYLEDVMKKSFGLCNECRCFSTNEIENLRNEFKLAFRIRILPVWKKSVFVNEINYNDHRTYRHDSRTRHVSLPSFPEWLQLCSTWHENNTISMEKIGDYLGKHSHPQVSNHSNCNWCQVADDVDNYLFQLLDKIKEIDPLFEAKQFHKYGSSSEKTDVFLPSEFDRLVVLKHFRSSPYNPQEVVYAGTFPETDSLEVNQPINSSSLLLHITDLIKAAKEIVSNVYIFGPIIGYSETCVTIHFLYRGRYPPTIKCSVDLTIAVEIIDPTTNIALPVWCQMPDNLPAYLVPFRRVDGSRWQTSYPTVERDLILKGGDCVVQVYKLLKLLVALHRAKEVRKEEIPRKICPSSYALKTCLYLHMFSYPPPWHFDDIIQHAIGVLNNYPKNSSELKSFFDQDQVIYEVSQKSKDFVSEIIGKLKAMHQSNWNNCEKVIFSRNSGVNIGVDN